MNSNVVHVKCRDQTGAHTLEFNSMRDAQGFVWLMRRQERFRPTGRKAEIVPPLNRKTESASLSE